MTPAFLASVTSVLEAQLAASCGVDIIDCKDPARGALGALSVSTVAAVRAALPKEIIVSATVGDLVCDPGVVAPAVLAMANSGCDLIKIGLFPGGDAVSAIAALGQLDLKPVRLVGLMLADCDPDFSLMGAMKTANFTGVMLDTALKSSGSLTGHLSLDELQRFTVRAHAHGLFAGFAGSLRLSDIATLIRLKPNVLGFRGALCAGSIRTGELSIEAVRQVRTEIDLSGTREPTNRSPASRPRAAE